MLLAGHLRSASAGIIFLMPRLIYFVTALSFISAAVSENNRRLRPFYFPILFLAAPFLSSPKISAVTIIPPAVEKSAPAAAIEK